MQRENRGPRLEKVKHVEAEARLRESILRRERGLPFEYPGRDEDLRLVRRKSKELGPERLRRHVGYGQHGSAKRGMGYGT